MKAFMKEFKEFISKGNVMDLAVGVIIGGAFQAIVGSLVNDIIMPLLGIITGGLDFSHLAITVGEAQILYGSFISAIINFLLMALVLFLVIKALNKAKSLTAKPEEENQRHQQEVDNGGDEAAVKDRRFTDGDS